MIVFKPITIDDSSLTSSNVSENDYSEWVSSTTYSVGDKVIVVATHKIYEALSSNSNKYPPDNTDISTPDWLDLGSTNRWRMFDDVVNSQTTLSSGDLVVTVTPGSVNAVALLNIVATSVKVELNDPSEGVVYSETVDLLSTSGITDWYAYFFYPIEMQTFVLLDDLPMYETAELTITLYGDGGDTACGVFACGLYRRLGCTVFGSTLGIDDYSKKDIDDFGNATLLEGKFSKRASFDVEISTENVDMVSSYLSELRATPCVWSGSGYFNATTVYGYYDSFDILLDNGVLSKCSISLKGLI